jgi:hypothetical protein
MLTMLKSIRINITTIKEILSKNDEYEQALKLNQHLTVIDSLIILLDPINLI